MWLMKWVTSPVCGDEWPQRPDDHSRFLGHRLEVDDRVCVVSTGWVLQRVRPARRRGGNGHVLAGEGEPQVPGPTLILYEVGARRVES